jgi:heat shock protein HtpX
MAKWAAIFGGSRDDRQGGSNPIALLAMAILAPIAALLIQMAISRQREYAADRGGAEIVGSPMGLATALRRIDSAAHQIPMDASPATAHMFIMNPFSGRGLASLFSSHPPTEERIKALMERRSGLA